MTFVSVAAHADPSDADRATARLLAQEGRQALIDEDFATAADRFRRAEALLHAPTLLLGLALAESGLGHLVVAQELLQKIIREEDPRASDAFVQAVADAKQALAALEPRIPLLTIGVQGAPGAEVTIDGVGLPSAAIGVARPIDPGRHVVRVTAPGKKAAEVSVDLAEGQRLTVPVQLEDEAVLAKAPEKAATPPAKGLSTLQVTGIVALVSGGVGLGVGAVTGGLAIAKHDELAEACPDGQCGSAVPQASLDEYATLGTVSTVTFIVGGALAATGVVLLVVAPAPEAEVAVSAGPTWLGISGRF